MGLGISSLRLGLHARNSGWLGQQIAALTAADGTKPAAIADFEAWRFAIPTIGPELVANGDFGAVSDWTTFTGWAIAAGVASYSGSGTDRLFQAVGLESGKSYNIRATATGAGCAILLGQNSTLDIATFTGSIDTYFTVTGSDGTIYFRPNAGAATVDNVSVREVITSKLVECTFAEWFAFTSASDNERTYTNNSGNVANDLSANEPRRDYSSGLSRLKIEAAATNLVTYTDFDGALPTGWTAPVNTGTRSFTTQRGVSSIRFQATAQRPHLNQTLTLATSTTYTVSALVTNNGVSTPAFSILAVLNFTGATGTTNATAPAPGQTERVSFTFTTDASDASGIIRFGLGAEFADTGDITISEVQVEAGSFATSWVPTTSATATREADAARFAPLLEWFVQGDEATIFAWSTEQKGTGTILGGASSVKLVKIVDGNTVRATQSSNLDVDLGLGATTGELKSGIAFDGTGRTIAANNSSATDANGPGDRSAVYLGRSGTVSSDFGTGLYKKVVIYPARISDASLVELVSLGAVYVDSVNGDDNNDGLTSDTAFQTISRIPTIVDGMRIWLANGSSWREEIVSTASNVQIKSYGSGAKPVLDGTDVAANGDFSLALINAYTISWDHASMGGSKTKFSVWEDSTRLTRVADAATCDSTPGSFYAPQPIASTTQTIYVHPTGSTDPTSDGKTYQITARDYGINLGTGATVDGVRTRRQMHNDGSTVLGLGATAMNSIFEDGTVHNMFVRSGTVEDCIFYKGEAYAGSGSSTLFIGYADDANGLDLVVRGCVFIGNNGAGQNAIYCHDTSGAAYRDLTVEDCAFAEVAVGITATSENLYSARNRFRSVVFAIQPATSDLITSTDDWFDQGLTSLTTVGTRFLNALNAPDIEIIGLRSAARRSSGALVWPNGASTVSIRNSVFAFVNLTGTAVAIKLASTGQADVQGVIFKDGSAYIDNAAGSVFTSDFNVLNPSTTDATFNGSAYTDIASYQAASGQDAGSSTANPQIVDPANGDFTTDPASPARALGAGIDGRGAVTYTAIPSDAAIAAM